MFVSGDPLIPADKRRMLDEENIAMTMAYNFMSAFVACLVIILLGEWLAKLTKGWIPSVFISAVIILCCFWTFLPKTVVADSKLLPVGSSVAIFLLIAHMGTLFSLKRLLEQWKTVVICLAGLAGMCGLAWVVCPLFMDKALVITGLPPLAGGIVATTIMQKAANDLGLTSAAVFAISMYCIQGFAGYPLTGIRVAVYDGSYHSVDSNEMAFRAAARIGLRKACADADPVVLEPIEEITVTIPESYAGAVMGDISASRGRVTGMETDERGDTVVIAQAPLAELTDYSTRLRSITRGTGDFTMKPAGYEQVPYDVQAKLVERYEEDRAK